MSRSDTFSHESLQDQESIVAYLRAVADGLAAGRLVLRADDEEVILRPHDLLRLKVEGRSGKHRSGIRVQVSWREDPPTETLDEGELHIDAGKG